MVLANCCQSGNSILALLLSDRLVVVILSDCRVVVIVEDKLNVVYVGNLVRSLIVIEIALVVVVCIAATVYKSYGSDKERFYNKLNLLQY